MADIVANSSYYILNNQLEHELHQAQFYDVDGNLLLVVPLERDEWWHQIHEKYNKMLDHRFVGKARPSKIVVENVPKFGRSAWFYDRHGNLIKWYKYAGPIDLKSVMKVGNFDRDWMLANNVPVDDQTYENWSLCTIL